MECFTSLHRWDPVLWLKGVCWQMKPAGWTLTKKPFNIRGFQMCLALGTAPTCPPPGLLLLSVSHDKGTFWMFDRCSSGTHCSAECTQFAPALLVSRCVVSIINNSPMIKLSTVLSQVFNYCPVSLAEVVNCMCVRRKRRPFQSLHLRSWRFN